MLHEGFNLMARCNIWENPISSLWIAPFLHVGIFCNLFSLSFSDHLERNFINVGALWVRYKYDLLFHRIFVDYYMLFASSICDFTLHSWTYATFFYWLFYFIHNYWILDLDFMLQKNIIDLLLGYNPILWGVHISTWNWT